MRTIHKSTDAGLETVERETQGCWIEIANPGPAELQALAQELGVSTEFINSLMGPDIFPRVEKIEAALVIVVRIPYFRGATATIPYLTLPLSLIVTRQRVLTLCRQKQDLLQDLPEEFRDDFSTVNSARLVLYLLLSIANSYPRHVNEVNRIIDRLEDRLQKSLQNREVLELLRHQKSLVHFNMGLKTNEEMLERLQRGKFLKLNAADEDLLDDVITENHEAMQVAGIANDILAQMMDAFASIIANNLNVVMKFLAAVTIILMIPSTIATYYGMNVPLPLEDSPYAFPILLVLSLLSSGSVAFIFWKKGWL